MMMTMILQKYENRYKSKLLDPRLRTREPCQHPLEGRISRKMSKRNKKILQDSSKEDSRPGVAESWNSSDAGTPSSSGSVPATTSAEMRELSLEEPNKESGTP